MKTKTNKAASVTVIVPMNPWSIPANMLKCLARYQVQPRRYLEPPEGLAKDLNFTFEAQSQLSIQRYVENLRKQMSDPNHKVPRLDAFSQFSTQGAEVADYQASLDSADLSELDYSRLGDDLLLAGAPFMLDASIWVKPNSGNLAGLKVQGPASAAARSTAERVCYLYSPKHTAKAMAASEIDAAAIRDIRPPVDRLLEGRVTMTGYEDFKRLHGAQHSMFEACFLEPFTSLIYDKGQTGSRPFPDTVLKLLERQKLSLSRQKGYLAPYLRWSIGYLSTLTAKTFFGTYRVVPVPTYIWEFLAKPGKMKKFQTVQKHSEVGELTNLLGALLASSDGGILADDPVKVIERSSSSTAVLQRWASSTTGVTVFDHCVAVDHLLDKRGVQLENMARLLWGAPVEPKGGTLDFVKAPLSVTDGEMISARGEDVIAGTTYVVPVISPAAMVGDGLCEKWKSASLFVAPIPRERGFDDRTSTWGLPGDLLPMSAYMGEPGATRLSGANALRRMERYEGQNLGYRTTLHQLGTQYPNVPGAEWFNSSAAVGAAGFTLIDTPTGPAVLSPEDEFNQLARADLKTGQTFGALIKNTDFVSLREAGKMFNDRVALSFTHPSSFRTTEGLEYDSKPGGSDWIRYGKRENDESDDTGDLTHPADELIKILVGVGLL